MKKRSLLAAIAVATAGLLLLPFVGFSQKTAKPAKAASSAPASGVVTLTCKFINFPPNADSLTLFDPAGVVVKPAYRTSHLPNDSSTFVFKIPMSKPRFYAIGIGENAVGKLILGEEKDVTVWGNAQYIEKSRTVNSAINRAYEGVQRRAQQFQDEALVYRGQLLEATQSNNAAGKTAVQERFAKLAKTKMHFLDSLKTANPLLWRVGTLLVQPDYQAEATKKYNTEYEFLGNEYFRYVDFKDAAYEQIPDLYTGFENYAKALPQFGANAEQARALYDAQLAKLPAGSMVSRIALAGLVSGLKAGNSSLYPAYASQYVNAYRATSMGEVARLDYDLKRNSTFTAGMEAPDLAGETPEGTQYALSQMRGKYVLVDFWASWCGPCRREMPNVKAVYEKYKDKGFDVLGVSLDREAGAWKKAIETDGLPWHHISDLKGWNSEHAKLYSVTSIPQTLLVDKDGKIIVRNLRGPQLEEKLKEVFGM